MTQAEATEDDPPRRPMRSMAPTLDDEDLGEPSVRPTVSLIPPPSSAWQRASAWGRGWPRTPVTVRKLAVFFAFVAGTLVVVASLLGVAMRQAKRHAGEPGHGRVQLVLLELAQLVEDVERGPAALSPAAGAGTQPGGAGTADDKLARKGRSPLSGGLLTLPESFHSEDGAYDLLVHFHGNTNLVEESVGYAKLNAVLVLLNLGVGSGPYEDRYVDPLAFAEILERVQATMVKRGLAGAHLRRVALSAWSAGYGAVERILDNRAYAERVDAVLLLDGIHVGFLPGSTELDALRLGPLERYARAAAAGEKLFLLTHSEILPVDYAGTHATTDLLLQAVGATRTPGGATPEMPPLGSLEGILPRKKVKPLAPLTEARRGGLVVRGYAGNQPEDHLSHLMQMATSALPDLVARWAPVEGSAPPR